MRRRVLCRRWRGLNGRHGHQVRRNKHLLLALFLLLLLLCTVQRLVVRRRTAEGCIGMQQRQRRGSVTGGCVVLPTARAGAVVTAWLRRRGCRANTAISAADVFFLVVRHRGQVGAAENGGHTATASTAATCGRCGRLRAGQSRHGWRRSRLQLAHVPEERTDNHKNTYTPSPMRAYHMPWTRPPPPPTNHTPPPSPAGATLGQTYSYST